MKQNKIFVLIFFTALSFCLPFETFALDLEQRVIRSKLKNGITVLMMERHISPTVSLFIRHRIGAVDEKPGETGAAHMLEHMMFKGTKTIGTKDYAAEKILLEAIEETGTALDKERNKGQKADAKTIEKLSARLRKLQDEHKKYVIPNEIDRIYTQNGGLDMNASTGQDVTTYHVSLPANKIELWARIESDRLLNPVFREFYTEREVVMEERRQRVDTNPEGKLYEEFMNTAYKVHPYKNPILGWPEDIMNYRPATMKRFFEKYRAPENTVIAVVGAINPKETLKLIEKYFGQIPAAKQKDTPLPPEPKQTQERRAEVIFDANPAMIIGYHKPNFPAFDDYVFDVMETILSQGRTSRFYNVLLTQMQIATSVNVYNGLPAARYPNLFTIFARPRHPHTNDELEEVIYKEIDKLKTKQVTAQELTKAKNQMRMKFIGSLDSNSKIASIISYYEVIFGDYKYFSDYLKNIDKITAEDIRRVANTYLNKENRTVAVLKKKEE
ncbi:MAG TPA: insulinase family protein [Deltaproteobacteria bacterium]|nr:insulinase family protein [Deltaproteobacteria bacterium]